MRGLFRNALAILTILICGAGLAGSLIEQIDGSRAAEPQTESSPQTSFASESESGINWDQSKFNRFSTPKSNLPNSSLYLQ